MASRISGKARHRCDEALYPVLVPHPAALEIRQLEGDRVITLPCLAGEQREPGGQGLGAMEGEDRAGAGLGVESVGEAEHALSLRPSGCLNALRRSQVIRPRPSPGGCASVYDLQVCRAQ
jgi:hypothetical protein